MPPGQPHLVYTGGKTIAKGGHFMTYGCLHLVLLARMAEVRNQWFSPNACHHSLPRTLDRMAIHFVTNKTLQSEYMTMSDRRRMSRLN